MRGSKQLNKRWVSISDTAAGFQPSLIGWEGERSSKDAPSLSDDTASFPLVLGDLVKMKCEQTDHLKIICTADKGHLSTG